MLAILAVVLPVFGLIGLGYIARATGYVSERTGDGLSDFVFSIAVPALVFKTLASAALPAEQPWGYWTAYFTAVAIVWATGMIVARRYFNLDRAGSIIAGFTAAQANTVLVGVPVILEAFGEAGAVPLFMLIAIHLPIMVCVGTLMMEGSGANLLSALLKLTHNPIVLAILFGAAAQFAGFTPGGFVKVFLDMLSQAAVPCALIAMGIALHRYGLDSGLALPSFLSLMKLVIHPLIVFVLARHVFSMPPAWSGVAVLFAACPCGVNAYLFASRYGAGVGVASSGIALSTVLSVATTVFWLWMLGVTIR